MTFFRKCDFCDDAAVTGGETHLVSTVHVCKKHLGEALESLFFKKLTVTAHEWRFTGVSLPSGEEVSK